MKIGTYYYPEQWPRSQWERDFDHIAAMGLQIVHMGEFAWFASEPELGKINLDWLSDCVEMCAKRKLAVILCTPPASPPVWLSEKYPEVLIKDMHGTPLRHGGRRHYSPTSPVMKEATHRIVSALAERFGNHKAVIGWHIDNEYSGPFGQNDHTHAAFRQWLNNKYQSIQNLNKAWGTQFWNTYYTSFEQILFPPSRDSGYANPHQHLDASRFWSWAYADFNKMQADILKPKIGKRFLTTNFMPLHLDCNPGDFVNDLSLMSWDSYPVTGWDKNVKGENYRMADPAGIELVHDQMASYCNRWAMLEVQPGQLNWSGYPVLLYPGAVRLWLWTALAHGAEFTTVYRFRQARFGTEMFHHGLIGHDGVTPTPGGVQFRETISEVKALDPAKLPALADEKDDPKQTVGLMMDFEQLWWYATLPQAKRWDQGRLLRLWHSAISRLGLKVKIIQPGQEIPKDMAMLVVPGMQMVDDVLVKQLEQYATSGGHLVLTCRTALMDRTGKFWEGPTAQPILSLIGGTIDAYDGLPEETFGQVEMDGKKYPWGVWGDLLYAAPETKVLAKYADQFYAGAAAVMQNKVGKGIMTYCGVYGESDFTDALMQKLATQSKLKTSLLPSRVRLLRRGNYRILLNYQDVPFDAPAPRGAKFLVGSRKVEPAGVAVWEE